MSAKRCTVFERGTAALVDANTPKSRVPDAARRCQMPHLPEFPIDACAAFGHIPSVCTESNTLIPLAPFVVNHA